jgi:hypothetical protein
MAAGARVLGMVQVGSPAVAAVLFCRLLGQFRRYKAAWCETQIQWLMATASGRKRRWCIGSDVTDGSQNGLSLKLSPAALQQGWVGIEMTSVESMGSAELEGVLQEYFYDDVSFRQLVNEPLLYGVAPWVIVAYLTFMMREDIGEEWRQLRRAVTEPKWSSNSGGISPRIERGLSLEFGRELPIGMVVSMGRRNTQLRPTFIENKS